MPVLEYCKAWHEESRQEPARTNGFALGHRLLLRLSCAPGVKEARHLLHHHACIAFPEGLRRAHSDNYTQRHHRQWGSTSRSLYGKGRSISSRFVRQVQVISLPCLAIAPHSNLQVRGRLKK